MMKQKEKKTFWYKKILCPITENECLAQNHSEPLSTHDSQLKWNE
jgi:hypothetical protein